MTTYDNDSSESDGEESHLTNVLLGYATTEDTDDDISHLGGKPTWLGDIQPRSADLIRCRVCNTFMVLILQLHANLPEHFPGHERQLYVFGCMKVGCRRHEGSIVSLRGTRIISTNRNASETASNPSATVGRSLGPRLGDHIFGCLGPTQSLEDNLNPFKESSSQSTSVQNNPFKAATNSEKGAVSTADQPINKAVITRGMKDPSTKLIDSHNENWPSDAILPSPFPHYNLDAEYEMLDANPKHERHDLHETLLNEVEERNGAGLVSEEVAFESTVDHTFQKFADRLAQNPLQVIRYEYRGVPLLYTRKDKIGSLFQAQSSLSSNRPGSTRIPPCEQCGGARDFEVQLTPQAITELELDSTVIDGMEWGTIIVAVCRNDCVGAASEAGCISYHKEWTGVQWEEQQG